MNVCLLACMPACVRVSVSVCVCMCVRVCACVYVCLYVFACVCAGMQACGRNFLPVDLEVLTVVQCTAGRLCQLLFTNGCSATLEWHQQAEVNTARSVHRPTTTLRSDSRRHPSPLPSHPAHTHTPFVCFRLACRSCIA